MDNQKTFQDLGLSPEILAVLKHKGFEAPTPVQQQVIPAILTTNKNILAQAQTGTGKTAAFGLPLIETLNEKIPTVQALILAPTRELAVQVTEEINSFKGRKQLNIVPIYGGQSIDLQFRRLKKGAHIIVGTPGRIIDHIRRRTLQFNTIDYLILDEADEMLNMGFLEDVETIIKTTPADKRVLLFSATMPPEIKQIAQKYMGEHISFKVTPGQLTVSLTDQIYFEVSHHEKFEALCRIIDMEENFYGLVFCRTKVDVDQISTHLIERGYDAKGLHGDLSQNIREKILGQFKSGAVNILVATDVAARGIDVQNLTHVINYALPQDPEAYVHRIGRTGRAGKAGNAVTFVTPSEYRQLQHIQRKVNADIRKAKLPSLNAVIAVRKKRITTELEQMIKTSAQREYLSMAQELLQNNSPQDALAALLQYTFADELREKTYAAKEETTVDAEGKTRLFIKQGRAEGLTRGKLIFLIEGQCGISGKNIRDIEILEKFSFITLPFQDAERVLDFFKQNKKDRIVVQRAQRK